MDLREIGCVWVDCIHLVLFRCRWLVGWFAWTFGFHKSWECLEQFSYSQVSREPAPWIHWSDAQHLYDRHSLREVCIDCTLYGHSLKSSPASRNRLKLQLVLQIHTPVKLVINFLTFIPSFGGVYVSESPGATTRGIGRKKEKNGGKVKKKKNWKNAHVPSAWKSIQIMICWSGEYITNRRPTWHVTSSIWESRAFSGWHSNKLWIFPCLSRNGYDLCALPEHSSSCPALDHNMHWQSDKPCCLSTNSPFWIEYSNSVANLKHIFLVLDWLFYSSVYSIQSLTFLTYSYSLTTIGLWNNHFVFVFVFVYPAFNFLISGRPIFTEFHFNVMPLADTPAT
jgi:hypothetical protein